MAWVRQPIEFIRGSSGRRARLTLSRTRRRKSAAAAERYAAPMASAPASLRSADRKMQATQTNGLSRVHNVVCLSVHASLSTRYKSCYWFSRWSPLDSANVIRDRQSVHALPQIDSLLWKRRPLFFTWFSLIIISLSLRSSNQRHSRPEKERKEAGLLWWVDCAIVSILMLVGYVLFSYFIQL